MSEVIKIEVDGKERPFLIPEQYRNVPERTLRSLLEYVENAREPGGFVRAVLENNLRDAMVRADLQNRAELYNIVMFVTNYLPMGCWGSPDKVHEWLLC